MTVYSNLPYAAILDRSLLQKRQHIKYSHHTEWMTDETDCHVYMSFMSPGNSRQLYDCRVGPVSVKKHCALTVGQYPFKLCMTV